jgi:hypothetical protein
VVVTKRRLYEHACRVFIRARDKEYIEKVRALMCGILHCQEDGKTRAFFRR